jgi:hypothetical protein
VAVTYEVFEALAVLVVVGLLVAWRIAPALTRPRWASPASSTDAESGSRRIRTAIAAVLVALLVAAAGLHQVGVPLAPFDQPLQFGHAYEAGGPSLLTRIAGRPGIDEFDYAYAPGTQIRSAITLQNSGGLPLWVTGLVNSSIPYVSSVALRLPADPVAVDTTLDSGVNGPFRSFQIPAHGEATLALVVTIGECSSIPPTPTLGPNASAFDGEKTSVGGVLTSVSELHIEYTVFGLARTATIALPFSQVVIGPQGTSGCPAT